MEFRKSAAATLRMAAQQIRAATVNRYIRKLASEMRFAFYDNPTVFNREIIRHIMRVGDIELGSETHERIKSVDFHAAVHSAARSSGVKPQEIDDIVQEALQRILSESFIKTVLNAESPAMVAAFIQKMVRNLIATHYRRLRDRPTYSITQDSDDFGLGTIQQDNIGQIDHFEDLDRRERTQFVQDFIDSLPDNVADVIRLVFENIEQGWGFDKPKQGFIPTSLLLLHLAKSHPQVLKNSIIGELEYEGQNLAKLIIKLARQPKNLARFWREFYMENRTRRDDGRMDEVRGSAYSLVRNFTKNYFYRKLRLKPTIEASLRKLQNEPEVAHLAETMLKELGII